MCVGEKTKDLTASSQFSLPCTLPLSPCPITKTLTLPLTLTLIPWLQAGSMGKIETKSKNKSGRGGEKGPRGSGSKIGAAGKQVP